MCSAVFSGEGSQPQVILPKRHLAKVMTFLVVTMAGG